MSGPAPQECPCCPEGAPQECPCPDDALVFVARPGRVFVLHGHHTPDPGEVPIGKRCQCDECRESGGPPREAFGKLYPVPDDLALWECSVCGEFSMMMMHLRLVFEWLDRDHPLPHMAAKARAEQEQADTDGFVS